MSVKIAITKIDLKGLFQEKMAFYDPVEMVLYSFFADQRQTHLIMCDMMHMCFPRVNELRLKISSALSISDSEIIFHFTHDHTGPRDEHMDIDKMVSSVVKGIRQNEKDQVEGKMASVSIDTNGSHNINRRKMMPHGMGKFTVWTGCEEKEGKLDGSRIAINRLKCWLGDDFELDELKEPLFYDDDRDTMLHVVLFKNNQDEILGSLTRFCAHPAVAGHTLDKRYSADFPGYVRRIMKEKFGGEHGYLTGPCGNICAWEVGDWLPLKTVESVSCMLPMSKMKGNDDSFIESQRIAKGLVGYIENNLPGDSEYKEITSLENNLVDFKIALREELYDDIDKASEEAKKIRDDLLKNRGKYSLEEHKKLADKANFYDYHGAFYDRGYLDLESYQKGYVAINIPSFKINDLIFQGMPGESFWQTAEPVHRWAKENNVSVITFSFANGSVTYLPTDEERPYGDYEATYSICKKGVVTKLADEILVSSQQYEKK